MASKVNRAKKIKLIGMDIDGVLTGGQVIVLESGEEVKLWNAKDRLGLALMRDTKIPIKTAWITGRQSRAVAHASKDLGIHYLVQKCRDKKKALSVIMKKAGVRPDETAFIGDDLIDLPALRSVGFAACPRDAVADVRRDVHYISTRKGGEGAVRDICDFILKAQNRWHTFVRPYVS